MGATLGKPFFFSCLTVLSLVYNYDLAKTLHSMQMSTEDGDASYFTDVQLLHVHLCRTFTKAMR